MVTESGRFYIRGHSQALEHYSQSRKTIKREIQGENVLGNAQNQVESVVKWHLMILVCSNLTAQCEWKTADTYFSEGKCVEGALMIPNLEFKCKRFVESFPIPRPRPLTAPR